MSTIKIHIMHTGQVRVAQDLPFGGEHTNLLKASGLLTPASKKLWLPVSAYLIEHPKGLILVDTGWSREMSPDGTFDKKAQIKHLGSHILYHVNQGLVAKGEAVVEQLATLGYAPEDLDYVLMTHLDCDHASGLHSVATAKNILVSRDELLSAPHQKPRYQEKWWKDIPLTAFDWTEKEGPFQHSYDLFGDGSIQMIHIPGHADGLFAVKVTNGDGDFVLLASDAGYAEKSWKELILPGISLDKDKQMTSLKWVKAQSELANCIQVIANHDTAIKPQVIEF